MDVDPAEDIVSHAVLLTLPVTAIPLVRRALEALAGEGVRVVTTRTGAERTLWIQIREGGP